MKGLKGTDEELAATLNIKNVSYSQNIKVSDIKKYLIVTGKILAIKASTDPAALITVEALDAFDEFVMSDPSNVTALKAQLDGLINASILNTTDKTILLSLGDSFISLSDQAGLGLVRAGDVQFARGLI